MDSQNGTSSCMPASWREDSGAFVANIVLVMAAGTAGSAFTLAAVPYAALGHKDKFPGVWTYTTHLLLHISLCDLLYCILGRYIGFVISFGALPNMIYSKKVFPCSSWSVFTRGCCSPTTSAMRQPS